MAILWSVPGAARAAGTDDEYVKYYMVQSKYSGSPENLAEIAGRFLRSDARSSEIFDLNVGRPQPDGKSLTDPVRLDAGWALVMPWDAVGSGVHYGHLPTSTAPEPAPRTTSRPSRGTGKGSGVEATPTGAPVPRTVPTRGNVPVPNSASCAGAASNSHPDWAALRLAADLAWPQSRGSNQRVAIVDSGVNAKLPQLAGRVNAGRNFVDRAGRGDVDCIGTGSSMAALVTAHQTPGSALTGIAPQASILPLKVQSTAAPAPPRMQAEAIAYAASAGADIIALGPAVDATTPEVADAVVKAAGKDVVVVVGAPTDRDVPHGAAVIRVAGVSVDAQTADSYRKGSVDVAAPGVNVTSLGITGSGGIAGTGTYYAVAFVAGEVALVRAAYPDLTAVQVVHRIEVTADPMGEGTVPNTSFGWGMINPSTSVTRVLPEEAATASDAPDSPAAAQQAPPHKRTLTIVVVVVMMLAAAAYLVLRIQRIWRGNVADEDMPETEVRAPAPMVMSQLRPPAAVADDSSAHWTDRSADAGQPRPEMFPATPAPPHRSDVDA
ncbi:S8 family peptidase [Actinoplanes sp. NPDC051343]|uniref:S8 family peptidase n=1 Tax=Actinoplanes sp. NPDC051343 TaxID=3363906 RepID=UPI0037918965